MRPACEPAPGTAAAQNWALDLVDCDDGDVIAINLGLSADNQSRSLATGVGFTLYENQEGCDIAFVDDSDLANSWVEFSSVLAFQNVTPS